MPPFSLPDCGLDVTDEDLAWKSLAANRRRLSARTWLHEQGPTGGQDRGPARRSGAIYDEVLLPSCCYMPPKTTKRSRTRRKTLATQAVDVIAGSRTV